MARYAFNSKNNLIKGLSRKKNFLQICTYIPLSVTTKKLSVQKLQYFQKIMESEFPCDTGLHIYTLCPKCIHRFAKFHAAVLE